MPLNYSVKTENYFKFTPAGFVHDFVMMMWACPGMKFAEKH